MSGPNETSTTFDHEQDRARFAAFEQQLSRAIRPVEAPQGFAERVLARAETSAPPAAARPPRGRLIAMPHRWSAWAGGAVAALIVLGVLQGERIHELHQRQAEAQRQFETAERITDQALAQTRAQLLRAGISLQP